MSVQLPLRFRLDSHTGLEDYVGEAGRRLLALDHLIIVYGKQGTGKSHLLQGLCHNETSPNKSVLYLPMRSSIEPVILQGLEHADLVCLDDVDKILLKPGWQKALFHLINACRDRDTKLVLSSSETVGALSIDLPDLVSRLKGGYLVPTDRLSDGDKLKVIRIKAKRRGFDMDEDVCRYILSRSQRDMHHLSRLVDQLDEATLQQQKKVTIPFVKQALGL